jgi:glycosyltransferase involved in cell wall biosynthesis
MTKPLRVYVLIDRYLPILGGAQNNVHLLFGELSARGFQVTVLTRRVERDLAKTETIDGIAVRRFAGSRLRLLSKAWCIAAFVWEMARHRRSYDVVVSVPCVPITDELPAYLGCLLTGKPYIIRTTSLEFERFLTPGAPVSKFDDLIPAAVWRRVFSRARVMVTQSSMIEQRARELGIHNVVTVPNAVDTRRFAPATAVERQALRERLGLPADKAIAVYTSRYVQDKNHLVLIRAAARIERHERPGRLHVILLGATEKDQSSSTEQELKRYVAENDLGAFVELRDDVANVEDYLRASDMFVFPTAYDEGMSNSQLEAMACGLPVIASRLPQVLAVLPADWPFTFDADDEDALVDLLSRAIDDPDQLRLLGAKLAQQIQARHALSEIAQRYAELLRHAADDTAPDRA